MGHADFVRSSLASNIDPEATSVNALALTFPGLAAIPIHFETDREILDTVLSMIWLQRLETVRIVWIRNTSSLAGIRRCRKLARLRDRLSASGRSCSRKSFDNQAVTAPVTVF
jgi:hypothetical protein